MRVRHTVAAAVVAAAVVAPAFAGATAAAPAPGIAPTTTTLAAVQSAAYAKNAKKATKSQRDGLRITDWYHDPIGRMVFDFRLARRLDGGDQMRRNVAIGFVDITGLDDVDTNGYRVVDTDTLKQSNPALYDELGLADRPGIQRFAIVPKANNPSTNDADGAHSEIRLLTEELIYMGVSDTNRVFALYSDRKPCPGCDPRIPKSAKVFYTTPASGGSAARDAIWEAINAAKAAASDERASLKVQVAEQQALDAEQAKDEQVHEQYMSQQTQTLFQNGQNAGPCAGQEETAGQALLASEVTGAQGSVRADPCGGSRPTRTGSAGITTDSGLAKALSQPVPQAPGGIDFSSLQLNYLADPGDGSGLQYSFQASSAAVSSTPTDGLNAASLSSDAFFTWLELDPSTFWVNLNPTEPGRITDSQLGRTDAGRIMLQADLQMKRTVGQLIHPDTALGQRFWASMSGDCMSFRTWIVPGTAQVHQDGDKLYILRAPLNVEMESQYLQSRGGATAVSCPQQPQTVQDHNEQLFRSLVLPRLVQQVNTAPAYADLRRVYLARVAAQWYRQLSGEQSTTYGSLVDQGDISNWVTKTGWTPTDTFNQYVRSYTQGEFRVVHKQVTGNYLYTRTYVYGGVDLTSVRLQQVGVDNGGLTQATAQSLDTPTTGNALGSVLLGSPTPKQLADPGGSGRSGGFSPSSAKYPAVAVLLVFGLLLSWYSRRRRPTVRLPRPPQSRP